VATLVMDLDVDDPPVTPVTLGSHSAVRALVWQGGRPLEEITIAGRGAIAPERLVGEARRRISPCLKSAGVPSRTVAALPSITVAICTRDRPVDLEACLESLRGQKGPEREVLVVDNAPVDDGARDVTRRMSGIRYVREPLPGLTFARNRALREARGEILAFLDDDARPAPGWLGAAAGSFAADPAIAACAGPMLPAELETDAQELFELRSGFTQSLTPAMFGPEAPNEAHRPHWPCLVGTCSSANMAFRVEVLRELGGFDEALGPGTPSGGGDDHDIFYRLVRSGRRFAYEPAFLVRHRHRRDLASLRDQLESWGRGTTAFFAKCYATDRPRRRAALRATAWLVAHHCGRIAQTLAPRSARRFPTALAAVELAGCFRGPFAYAAAMRSLRRLRVAPVTMHVATQTETDR
jgi:glycosyltransferase involved in cell wall biosynthesis